MAVVVDRFRDELDEVESIFSSCHGGSAVRSYRIPYMPTEDGCLVSLWDAWNRFLRALCLTSCRGPTQGLSGTIYFPTAAMTEAQAYARIINSKKGRSYSLTAGEPKWYNAAGLPDLTAVLGLANDTVIVGAVTASTLQLGPISIENPLEEIRLCRNFVAHKTDATLREAQVVAGSAFPDLMTHVRAKRSGVETFSEWKEACLALAEAAAQ